MSGAVIDKTKDSYVYFLYSEQQHNEREAIEKTMSRVFTPGSVVVNGRKRIFTEISKKPRNRYPDSTIVAQGFRSNMVYTNITTG